MNTSAIEQVAEELEHTADWREQKALEHPNDERNRKASSLAVRLATEVRALSGTEAAVQFQEVWDAVWAGDDETYTATEVYSQFRRDIGFRSFPETGVAYIRELSDLLRQR